MERKTEKSFWIELETHEMSVKETERTQNECW